MKLNKLCTIFAFIAITSGIFAQETDETDMMEETEELQESLNETKELLAEVESTKEKMIMQDPALSDVLASAKGYVIFPDVDEAGFIIGGAYGEGAVYENGKFVGVASLKQLDAGLQAGFESFAQLLIFDDQGTLDKLKDGSFDGSAEMSAVALNKGVAEKIQFKDGIAAVVMSKSGLMADMSIGAQRYDFEDMSDMRLSDF